MRPPKTSIESLEASVELATAVVRHTRERPVISGHEMLELSRQTVLLSRAVFDLTAGLVAYALTLRGVDGEAVTREGVERGGHLR